MPFPICGIQPVYKTAPPFLKGPVCLGYLQTAAGRSCLCLCGLSMKREGQGKINIQSLYRRHRLQSQKPGSKVYGIPSNITYPAAEPAIAK